MFWKEHWSWLFRSKNTHSNANMWLCFYWISAAAALDISIFIIVWHCCGKFPNLPWSGLICNCDTWLSHVPTPNKWHKICRDDGHGMVIWLSLIPSTHTRLTSPLLLSVNNLCFNQFLHWSVSHITVGAHIILNQWITGCSMHIMVIPEQSTRQIRH